jgi:hypothetical protein
MTARKPRLSRASHAFDFFDSFGYKKIRVELIDAFTGAEQGDLVGFVKIMLKMEPNQLNNFRWKRW